MTVLIVDDDDGIRESLARALDWELYVVELPHGQAALDWLAVNHPPTCIILDLMMPVMDGWEFQRRLQADPDLAQIPIIAITASSRRGEDFPCAALLRKPFDLDELEHLVWKFVGERVAKRQERTRVGRRRYEAP